MQEYDERNLKELTAKLKAEDPVNELNKILAKYINRPVNKVMIADYIRELLAWAKANDIEI